MKAESFACTMNSTSSRVVASVYTPCMLACPQEHCFMVHFWYARDWNRHCWSVGRIMFSHTASMELTQVHPNQVTSLPSHEMNTIPKTTVHYSLHSYCSNQEGKRLFDFDHTVTIPLPQFSLHLYCSNQEGKVCLILITE